MMTTMPRRSQPQPPRQPVGQPTQVRLPIPTREALGLIAAHRGIAVSAVIRDAIEDYLHGFEGPDGTLLEVAERGELATYGPLPDVEDVEAWHR